LATAVDLFAGLGGWSTVRSVNFGPSHAFQVSGDDDPCYPQRKEWIECLLGQCDPTNAELSGTVGRDHEIPGTSYQRLNAPANQGE